MNVVFIVVMWFIIVAFIAALLLLGKLVCDLGIPPQCLILIRTLLI